MGMLDLAKRGIGTLGEVARSWKPLARMKSGRLIQAYSLDSAKRVDPALARELYYNRNDDYKLGGCFARPVINTAVGFMGVPTYRLEDEDGQQVLEGFAAENVSRMQRTHRNALRDGDCHVWLTREQVTDNRLYPDREAVMKFNIIPLENIKTVNRHPLTRDPLEYRIETRHAWTDDRGEREITVITHQITPQQRSVRIEGKAPPGVEEKTEPNPWGFIPIVQFTNEVEEDRDVGLSDLEGIEPYLKAYHDVFKHAIQGSKLHSTPRLQLLVKDINAFLANNFGVDDPKRFIEEGRTIDLEGRDLLIFTREEEKAEFIEVKSAIGAAEPLLHLLFYCIVENSETPEFAFGAHLPANYASVKEQMPVLIRRVARKREFFEEPWTRLGRMVLAMTAQAEGRRYSTHDAMLEWDIIDPRDSAEIASELKDTVAALTDALDHNIISHESAVNSLQKLVDTMDPYRSKDAERPGERDKIVRSLALMNRMEDRELMLQELERLNEELEDGAA